jgi:hypothetical protein
MKGLVTQQGERSPCVCVCVRAVKVARAQTDILADFKHATSVTKKNIT